ncbi:hypothetical protein ROHU_018409 [Labeo rohita]|uniref:Uncharacterized protein n=1 Tax=Labeo rohita TaxID=84645 RepID=A0A498NAS6_LABRO|nr:hypothetical protein ROHU_018409 [Labeo rohita]
MQHLATAHVSFSQWECEFVDLPCRPQPRQHANATLLPGDHEAEHLQTVMRGNFPSRSFLTRSAICSTTAHVSARELYSFLLESVMGACHVALQEAQHTTLDRGSGQVNHQRSRDQHLSF